MMVPVTFVVCVEPGPHRLEYKSAGLFHTLRHNTGPFSGAAIWAYAPRPGLRVSKWCRELMEHYAVRLIDAPLNSAHPDYPLANKPLALAHAEEHATTEYVVFLDTDILAWAPPVDFLLPEGIDIALVPDATKTLASAGPGDPYEDYWQRMYTLVGASARPFVTTLLTEERVRGTWNSGVIALRRPAGIAAKWRRAMLSLLADDFSPPEASYLRENNILSAVVTAHFEHYRELSAAYNYHVQNWDAMKAKGISAEEAVLWHYQPYFNRVFHRFADRVDRANTLRERLSLTVALVDDLRVNYRKRIGLDESWLQSLRRRVRLGPRVRAMLGRSKPSDLQPFG